MDFEVITVNQRGARPPFSLLGTGGPFLPSSGGDQVFREEEEIKAQRGEAQAGGSQSQNSSPPVRGQHRPAPRRTP